MHRFPSLASAASAVVIFAATSTPSFALVESARRPLPIAVDVCRAFVTNAGKIASRSNTIEIAFHDIGKVPARSVDFDVDWGHGDVQTIHDVGTFAPGVTVRHTFVHPARDTSSPFFFRPAVTCSVEAVQLGDTSHRPQADATPTQSGRRTGTTNVAAEFSLDVDPRGRAYP